MSDAQVRMRQAGLLSRVSLPAQVYERLKQGIVSNQFPFGTKLTEEHLGNKLGVSRTPIREALNRLVQDGLVTASPGRGAFVTTFSPADIIEFFEVREALEGMAARLACPRITNGTRKQLRTQLEKGMAERERNGYTGYLEADREFHEAIILASANRHLAQIMSSLRDRIQMLRYRSVVLPGRARRSFEEHVAVIKAFSIQNPELAEQRMRTHVRNVKIDLIAAMKEHGSSEKIKAE